MTFTNNGTFNSTNGHEPSFSCTPGQNSIISFLGQSTSFNSLSLSDISGSGFTCTFIFTTGNTYTVNGNSNPYFTLSGASGDTEKMVVKSTVSGSQATLDIV